MSDDKSNVIRLFEAAGIGCTAHAYAAEDGRIDALSVAAKLGAPPERVFKTYETIWVSAGRVGLNVEINPERLAAFIGARFEPLVRE